jgi:hypothetical protein
VEDADAEALQDAYIDVLDGVGSVSFLRVIALIKTLRAATWLSATKTELGGPVQEDP